MDGDYIHTFLLKAYQSRLLQELDVAEDIDRQIQLNILQATLYGADIENAVNYANTHTADLQAVVANNIRQFTGSASPTAGASDLDQAIADYEEFLEEWERKNKNKEED